MLKASRYNVAAVERTSGDTVLVNTLSGSVSQWRPEEKAQLDRLLANPTCLGGDDEAVLKALVEQRNLVPEELDELAIVQQRKELGVRDPNRLDLVVLPTLDCNFSCTYCFETRRRSSMSDATEAAFRAFLSREIPQHKLTVLHWFGGEPLMQTSRILEITRHLLATAATAGVAATTHITTNGYLLDARRAQLLVAAGVRNYQITVDGTQPYHDQFRVLRNGRGTFDRVLAGIHRVARESDDVRVTLRINFNHRNVRSIPDLLQSVTPSIRHQLRTVFEPIFGAPDVAATENMPACEISDLLGQYYELAEGLGYDVSARGEGLPFGRLVYCFAEREHQVIVTNSGDIFKCSVDDFRPEARWGVLEADGGLRWDEDRQRHWLDPHSLIPSHCQDCAYLPLCMGGCRKQREEHKERNSCTLVPTNAHYVLKQLALSGVNAFLTAESSS